MFHHPLGSLDLGQCAKSSSGQKKLYRYSQFVLYYNVILCITKVDQLSEEAGAKSKYEIWLGTRHSTRLLVQANRRYVT